MLDEQHKALRLVHGAAPHKHNYWDWVPVGNWLFVLMPATHTQHTHEATGNLHLGGCADACAPASKLSQVFIFRILPQRQFSTEGQHIRMSSHCLLNHSVHLKL